MPTTCSGVPTEILNPATQWKNKGEFDSTLSHLAELYLVSQLRPRLCMLPTRSIQGVTGSRKYQNSAQIAEAHCPVDRKQCSRPLHELWEPQAAL